MSERQMCRKCFCLGYDLVPVNGEWSCLEHLSGHEAGAEIVRLNKQLAERTLQHQTQLDNAVDLTNKLAESEAALRSMERNRDTWHTRCVTHIERLAAAEAALARIALSETGDKCWSDFAQDFLGWKSTSELWDIIKAAKAAGGGE